MVPGQLVVDPLVTTNEERRFLEGEQLELSQSTTEEEEEEESSCWLVEWDPGPERVLDPQHKEPDLLGAHQPVEMVLRRTTRTTVGKHSNPHNLPCPVAGLSESVGAAAQPMLNTVQCFFRPW